MAGWLAAASTSALSPSQLALFKGTGLPCSPSPAPAYYDNSKSTTDHLSPVFATLAFDNKPTNTPVSEPRIRPSRKLITHQTDEASSRPPLHDSTLHQNDGASTATLNHSAGAILQADANSKVIHHNGNSHELAIHAAKPQAYQDGFTAPNPPIATPHGSSIHPSIVQHEAQLQSLPVLLPPSQLSLAELLRQDFNSAASFPEAICNVADTLITELLSPAELQPSIDPQLQLSGNCAPVAETPPTPCAVNGMLPADLNGIYLRNGPNATHLFRGEGYHLFDGNGMLHSVKIEDGKATFCARYVKTARFRQEAAAGRPLFPKFFGGLSGVSGAARTANVALRVVLGLMDVTQGWGLSNTSVGFFNGQVLSLSEDDMPYVIKVTESGDLVTIGHFKLPGTFNMCAHPKFDTSTGEMFAFGIHPPSMSPFSFFRVSADGTKSPHVPVPLFDVPLVHDFAITRKFVVFPDNQLVVRPIESLRGESALVCDANKTPRFCLMPRYALPAEAAEKAQWFEAPGCNCLHYINAWDEGADEVVLITPVLSPPESILEVPAVNTTCTLSEIRLNTATGKARLRKICVGNFEFGTFNHKYVGRRCRYVYAASGCFPRLTGVVKVDLQGRGRVDAVVARRDYGEGCTGGEPFFVPRKRESRSGEQQLAEDDGYLLCYVHNEGTGISELLVMDALSPSLQVIASVELPSRVPSGFHGWFISQEQLAQQS